VECQAEVFVDCQAEVMGECVTQCETEEGALFCDGQYVDHGDNLDACVDQLKDLLDIDVSGFIDGECDDNSCEVDAGGTFSCGVGGTGGGALAGWGLIGLAILVGVSRRRRGAVKRGQ
jgi:MYXO-CTERM domain-containing protein